MTFVNSGTGYYTSGSSITSFAVAFDSNVTAGSLLVAWVSVGDQISRDIGYLTDNNGNTWSLIPSTHVLDTTNGQWGCMAYAQNANAGATTVTVNLSGTVDAFPYLRVVLAEYTGVLTTGALDKSAGAFGAATTAANNVSSGATAALAQADELVVTGVLDDDANATYSAGTGYTLRKVSAAPEGYQCSIADKTVSSTAAVTGTWTASVASRYVASVATFKLAPAGAPGSVNAVAATATATALAPVVSGSSGGAPVNVNAVAATATAASPPPTVSGGNTVSGSGPATATAAALAPVVSGVRSPTVTAVAASATAAAVAPVVAGTSPGSPTVLAVAASAVASALAPVVSGVRLAQVSAVVATATATAVPPAVLGLDTDPVPAGNGYRFTPPTREYRVGQDDDHLWGRITNDTGLAVVVYTDGRVVTTTVAPSTSDDGVALVWPGGRTYTITDGEAALLIEAGYSANLEEIL